LLGIKRINCVFDKDLVLKAKVLKKSMTDWHESSHCCCHTITCSCEDKSVIWWIIILRNFFCDILYIKKSHQNHAIHLKSLSDTLNLYYFECMLMWYEHVYDVLWTCIKVVQKWVVRKDVGTINPVTGKIIKIKFLTF